MVTPPHLLCEKVQAPYACKEHHLLMGLSFFQLSKRYRLFLIGV